MRLRWIGTVICVLPACRAAVIERNVPEQPTVFAAAEPRVPAVPRHAAQRPSPSAAPSTMPAPAVSGEESVCPALAPGDGLALAAGPPSRSVRPPSPALLARLAPRQKDELALLGSLCETGVVRRDRGAIEVGCVCCPPFENCGPVAGGKPRGDPEEVYPVLTRSSGSFTRPGTRELAVTFQGCEPHSLNYGGTALYRELDGRWAFAGYATGFAASRCQPYRLSSGRDVLICEFSDAHQGSGATRVFIYDFAPPDRTCWTPLADFVDDTSLCEGEPGKPLTWSALDRVNLVDVNGDGILDLRLQGRERSGVPSAAFGRSCMALLRRGRAPTPAERSATLSLLGPLKSLSYDFISDGRHFTPTPSTKQALELGSE